MISNDEQKLLNDMFCCLFNFSYWVNIYTTGTIKKTNDKSTCCLITRLQCKINNSGD